MTPTRTYCQRCKRPQKNCLCSALEQQITHTPILIAQHEDERSHPFTTSYLASEGASSVCLQNAESLDALCTYQHLACTEEKPPYLVYVEHDYHSHQTFELNCSDDLDTRVSANSPELLSQLTEGSFIVLDGTWRNTRELMLRHAWLATLPILKLSQLPPSIYAIRKSQKEGSVSTIEAISYLLAALEPRFDRALYLRPLKELVEQQQAFVAKT